MLLGTVEYQTSRGVPWDVYCFQLYVSEGDGIAIMQIFS